MAAAIHSDMDPKVLLGNLVTGQGVSTLFML